MKLQNWCWLSLLVGPRLAGVLFLAWLAGMVLVAVCVLGVIGNVVCSVVR